LAEESVVLDPLKWAYRDTAEQARKKGWLWPSYETARRRFPALSVAARRTLMQSEQAAASSLTQYQPHHLMHLTSQAMVSATPTICSGQFS
jgi:hypothetical protein